MATEIRELSIGLHNVLWEYADHAPLNALIDVTETGVICKTAGGIAGNCYTTLPVTSPGVHIPPLSFTATGHLKELAVATDFTSWIESKGGVAAIEGNKVAVFEIKYGYAEIEDLGFTVVKNDVFNTLYYYAGII